jgi:hypothetical protein
VAHRPQGPRQCRCQVEGEARETAGRARAPQLSVEFWQVLIRFIAAYFFLTLCSDSDEESSESGASAASSSVCEDESGISSASSETATAEDASDDGAGLSSSNNDSADEVSDLEAPDKSAASALGSAGIARKARSGRSFRGNAEILKVCNRQFLCSIVRNVVF